MATALVETAIDRVDYQSDHGPAFAKNLCKKKTREAYRVDSDGSADAAEAWRRTDARIKVAGDKAPRGALLWWIGGSEGHGHVAIADGKGGVWSVDIKRAGYWDHVPFAQIERSWPALRFAGVSRDIDGVVVVAEQVQPPRVSLTDERLTRFRNRLNVDRVIDLNVLDELIKAGHPLSLAAEAKHAKWDAINAARAFLAKAER